MALQLSPAAAQALRPWTVEHSVATRYFVPSGGRAGAWWTPGDMDYVSVSPTGRHFFLLTRRGDLGCDCNIYEIALFESEAVRSGLAGSANSVAPISRTMMRSTSNRAAIGDVRWSADGTSLSFLGTGEGAIRQVYRLLTAGGAPQRLTDGALDVDHYEYAAGRVVYRALIGERARGFAAYPATVLSRFSFQALINPVEHRYAFFASGANGDFRLGDDFAAPFPAGPWLSPDGRQAVFAAPGAGGGVDHRHVDLATRRTRTIFPRLPVAGPGGARRVVVAWDPDGRNVVLTSSELAVRYNVATGGSQVETLAGRPAVVSATAPALPAGLEVVVQQGPNQPAFAEARSAGRAITLIPPDTNLSAVAIASTVEVGWREAGTRRGRGLLTLPTGAVGPRPLVIQIYQFHSDQFLPDGPFPASYAAQALAARGIAVLQIDRRTDGVGRGTLAESLALRDRVDAAVESLAADGVADRCKIGLVGFSNGGFQTYFLATHPARTEFAAAVDADGWTGGYVEDLVLGALQPSPAEAGMSGGAFNLFHGGSFGEQPQDWLEQAPPFSLRGLRTPIMFAWHFDGNVDSALAQLEVFVAQSRSAVPSEFLVLPDAEHQPKRPRERLVSLQATVDWMSFWLLDQVPPGRAGDPQRANRWREMQSRWQSIRAPFAPACRAVLHQTN